MCEYYCVSGGSHTSSTGPVQNPRKLGYTTGGSSSGSAALVAAGEVPMAIGGDQAGSIRIPASFCGIVGLKPTYGLVPYTGIGPLEITLDTAGPMTANVADNALLLEVIAGPDGLDSRQHGAKRRRNTPRRCGGGAKGLRIGVLKEGFGHRNSEPDVDAKVRAAAERFKIARRQVDEVSVPEHLTLGFPVWAAIRGDAACVTLLEMNGFGIGYEGFYPLSVMQAAMKWREHADEFADTLKIATIFSKYTLDRYGGHYYAKAQNLRRRLRAAYDAALASHDLLLLPTTVMKATPIPAEGREPAGDHAAKLGGDAQHLPVQRHRPSGDQHSLRHGGRPADRADAGRPALGGAHDLSRGRRRSSGRATGRSSELATSTLLSLPVFGEGGSREGKAERETGGD